jgi:hypothetical protein
MISQGPTLDTTATQDEVYLEERWLSRLENEMEVEIAVI